MRKLLENDSLEFTQHQIINLQSQNRDVCKGWRQDGASHQSDGWRGKKGTSCAIFSETNALCKRTNGTECNVIGQSGIGIHSQKALQPMTGLVFISCITMY